MLQLIDKFAGHLEILRNHQNASDEKIDINELKIKNIFNDTKDLEEVINRCKTIKSM